jgi:hypothetical protein
VLAILFATGSIAFAAVARHKGKAYKYAREALRQLDTDEES